MTADAKRLEQLNDEAEREHRESRRQRIANCLIVMKLAGETSAVRLLQMTSEPLLVGSTTNDVNTAKFAPLYFGVGR